MAKLRSDGLNKEKFACLFCLGCLCLLALLFTLSRFYPEQEVVRFYATLFGSAPPQTLLPPAPVTSKMPAPSYQEQPAQLLPSEANLTRKTPFAPSQYKMQVVVEPKPPTSVATAPPLPPPPVAPPKTVVEQKKPAPPKDKELEVAYMGVMQIQDETYGLLRAKDGSYRRVKAGEKMPDFNYTITRLEKQAIYLQTEDGRVYVLQNDRFSDVADGTDGGAKDNLPSFVDPNKAPQKAPQKTPQKNSPKAQPKTTPVAPPATAPTQRPTRTRGGGGGATTGGTRG